MVEGEKILSVCDEIVELCAVLERQHPRDLFDVALLRNSHGVDRSMFDGFLAYLLSHNRPISELMNPRWEDISVAYENEFAGMAFDAISLRELIDVPVKTLGALKTHFTQRDFDFQCTFKSGRPVWSLVPSFSFENLPAIK